MKRKQKNIIYFYLLPIPLDRSFSYFCITLFLSFHKMIIEEEQFLYYIILLN